VLTVAVAPSRRAHTQAVTFIDEGQRLNGDLAYATVPAALTARSEELIRQITVQGKPIFPNR
jgi:hypothetical protein